MINVKNKICGRFKFEKFRGYYNKNGELIEHPDSRHIVADWFDNLILDQGLDELGTRTLVGCINTCQVGSGNSTPTVTDTALQSHIASTTTTQSSSETSQSSTQPYYLSYQITKRFGAGDAEGILAEVGMGWSTSPSNSLFSRALINDSSGNPTTITVLADEFLDVTYELRVYPSDSDVNGSVNIGGVVYDYTARACRVDSTTLWDLGRDGTDSGLSSLNTAYTGSIGDVLSNPSGTNDSASSTTDGTYSSGSLQGSSSATWGLDDGNIGGIRSVRLQSGWTCWQIEFSAQSDNSPIPKDNTKTLTLTCSQSWARGTV